MSSFVKAGYNFCYLPLNFQPMNIFPPIVLYQLLYRLADLHALPSLTKKIQVCRSRLLAEAVTPEVHLLNFSSLNRQDCQKIKHTFLRGREESVNALMK